MYICMYVGVVHICVNIYLFVRVHVYERVLSVQVCEFVFVHICECV